MKRNSSVPATCEGNPWLVCFGPRDIPELRLVCFHHAGGSASAYGNWHRLLPPAIEVCAVQFPGRGARMGELPVPSIEVALERIDEALQAYLDCPFAFFGHSMGALLGFELACRLRNRWGVEPLALLVSARGAPHLPDKIERSTNLSDEQLLQELSTLGGVPPELLSNPELMQLVLPSVRSDIKICRAYRYAPRPALNCPITAYGGEEDQEIGHELLDAWREHTKGAFSLRMFVGGHFYLQAAQTLLLDDIARSLALLLSESQAKMASAQ